VRRCFGVVADRRRSCLCRARHVAAGLGSAHPSRRRYAPIPRSLAVEGRAVSRLMIGVPGLLAKDGAEGTFAAALPDGTATVVKIADGASRACRTGPGRCPASARARGADPRRARDDASLRRRTRRRRGPRDGRREVGSGVRVLTAGYYSATELACRQVGRAQLHGARCVRVERGHRAGVSQPTYHPLAGRLLLLARAFTVM